MTTTANTAISFRFKFVDDQTDIIYVGEAEVDPGSGAIDFLSVWEVGATVEEIFPYSKGFPIRLRHQLEQAALECRMTPPIVPIELPTDWDGIEILSAETTLTVRAKYALPDVRTDQDATMHGLSTVRRIRWAKNDTYQVTVNGPLSSVRRELYRARLF